MSASYLARCKKTSTRPLVSLGMLSIICKCYEVVDIIRAAVRHAPGSAHMVARTAMWDMASYGTQTSALPAALSTQCF